MLPLDSAVRLSRRLEVGLCALDAAFDLARDALRVAEIPWARIDFSIRAFLSASVGPARPRLCRGFGFWSGRLELVLSEAIPLVGGGFLKRSAIFALEAAVEAADTGCRGRELRRTGDVVGGGTLTWTETFGLSPDRLLGVVAYLRVEVGVTGRARGVVSLPAFFLLAPLSVGGALVWYLRSLSAELARDDWMEDADSDVVEGRREDGRGILELAPRAEA